MKKQIPNIITSMNLITGCISIVFALRGFLEVASLLILVSALFDFFDGFAARMLKVTSPIGIDMDSLADVVSFGVAPATILYAFMEQTLQNMEPALRHGMMQALPFTAFLIPAFSAFRLAVFNHDETQHTEFRGLATPANALFMGYLHFAARDLPILNNIWVLVGLIVLFSLLLVSRIPMFSLKFHNLKLDGNEIRYIFLFVSLILLLIFKLGAFPIIILTYLLISLLALAFKKR